MGGRVHRPPAAAAAAAVVFAAVVFAAACSSSPPNRMSRPQKADVGTTAWCQTLARAPSLVGGNSLTAIEQYIITPSHGHNGMGLPIEGTRLEADIEAARGDNGNQMAFRRSVQNVLADCHYILSKQKPG